MSQKGSSEEHTNLVNKTVFTVGSSKYARVWKNATGVARAMDNDNRIIRFGLPGSSDILGVVNSGHILCLECKTGDAKQNKQQRNFQKMIDSMGGIYILVRPETNVLLEVKRAIIQKETLNS